MPKNAKDAWEKLPDPTKSKRCKQKGCAHLAIVLEDFCWRHLPNKARIKYKDKIESWAAEGNPLIFVNLSRCFFDGINLPKAAIIASNLGGTFFIAANFEGAILHQNIFREADLYLANLQDAFLMATDLSRTNLSGANLQRATLIGANLRRANLSLAELQGAFLEGVLWDGALYLTWRQIKRVGEEKENNWKGARDAYARLRHYFNQQGSYGDENKAYYREKIMAKHGAHEKLCGQRPRGAYRNKLRRNNSLRKLATKGNRKLFNLFACIVLLLPMFKRGFQNVGRFLTHHEARKIRKNWLGLWVFHVFTGFGGRWWWTVLWALGVIAFFGFLYWGGGAAGWFKFAFKPEMIPSAFQYFYLSVVTFATLGFGDITPLNWQAQIPVVFEVIMGYVFLGLIITIIARRFGR